MAYDGWIEFNGVELVNLSRTAQLAQSLNITTVWVQPSKVSWIQQALGGLDYGNPTKTPWYDAGYPASAEFAGIVPLDFRGLDDSTYAAETTENVGAGGQTSGARNASLSIVANVVLVASTERGVEFGKRWMDKVLAGTSANKFCSGTDLRYFRYGAAGAPVAHRRDVSLTRGSSLTNKRRRACSSSWTMTFTLTADDSYEYGEEVPKITSLGATGGATGPGVLSSGNLVLVQQTCPQFDYTPIYDPLFPALVPSPTAPDFYPDGWDIYTGMTFQRFWARVSPVEPSNLLTIPIITLSSTVVARSIRVSIWKSGTATNEQCGPLFSAVLNYLPTGGTVTIDSEEHATYFYDGTSQRVRRMDSLVFGPDGYPVEWTAFNDNTNLLVTLDVFADSDGYEGNGNIRAALAMVPKSD